MLRKTTPRKIITLKGPVSHSAGDIEYRIVWSERDAHWEIHRNGAKTGASRRKKQSALDLAIRAIQSEVKAPEAKIVVTSLKDRALKTEWVSP
jgi:hypothetical protein